MKSIMMTLTGALLLASVGQANSDITDVTPVAIQMTVRGKTAQNLMSLMKQSGFKSSKFGSYEVRNIRINGRSIYDEDSGGIDSIIFSRLAGTDHGGDWSSRNQFDLDMTKTESRNLALAFYELAGSEMIDYAMGGRFGFNVPWVTCHSGSSSGGPICQVTVSTQLTLK